MQIEIISEAKPLVSELLGEFQHPVLLIFKEVEHACVTPDTAKWEPQMLESELVEGMDNIERLEQKDLSFPVYVEKLDSAEYPDKLYLNAKKYEGGIGLEQVFP